MLKDVALLLALVIGGAAPAASAPPRCPEHARTAVLVYDYAAAPPAAVLDAERQVGRIFRDACIALEWTNDDGPRRAAGDPTACQQRFPKCILLRIVDRAAEPSAREAAFAAAAMPRAGSAPSANVFYPAVRAIGRKARVPEGVVLACAIAHELGHLLLGPRAHSGGGVMRRVWTAADFDWALRGGLYFTREQSERMRAELNR